MSNRTIKHEVKLQPSVIVILGLLAFGVCANAFAPAFSVKSSDAGLETTGHRVHFRSMIVSSGEKGVWQLQGSKVRWCENLKCLPWLG